MKGKAALCVQFKTTNLLQQLPGFYEQLDVPVIGLTTTDSFRDDGTPAENATRQVIFFEDKNGHFNQSLLFWNNYTGYTETLDGNLEDYASDNTEEDEEKKVVKLSQGRMLARQQVGHNDDELLKW